MHELFSIDVMSLAGYYDMPTLLSSKVPSGVTTT